MGLAHRFVELPHQASPHFLKSLSMLNENLRVGGNLPFIRSPIL